MSKRGKTAQLSENHWKAIKLIEEGKTTMKEIAEIVGLKVDTLYKLYEGNDSAGAAGQLFHAEIRKIGRKQESEIKDLMRESKKLALRKMNDFLKRHNNLDYTSDDDAKAITTVFNALSKCGPNVEINATSYTYTKGLSAEDLMHEFNKLSSIAKGTSIRRGVQEPGSRIAGVLPELAESGSGIDQESEDPDLRSDA